MHQVTPGRLGPPNPKRFASSKGKSREIGTAPLAMPISGLSIPAALDHVQTPLR